MNLRATVALDFATATLQSFLVPADPNRKCLFVIFQGTGTTTEIRAGDANGPLLGSLSVVGDFFSTDSPDAFYIASSDSNAVVYAY